MFINRQIVDTDDGKVAVKFRISDVVEETVRVDFRELEIKRKVCYTNSLFTLIRVSKFLNYSNCKLQELEVDRIIDRQYILNLSNLHSEISVNLYAT